MDPGMDSGGGIPGWFIALFVIVAVGGVLTTVYKASMARDMAKRSGMDPDDAARMTVLTDNGLEATYLASNLRAPRRDDAEPPDAVPAEVPRSVAVRLRELQGLLDEGLITQAEYDARRRVILDQT